MPSARPIAYVVNILEASAVTAAGAVTTKPVTRVYDRAIGPEYEDSATTGDRWIAADQIGTLEYDTMLVAPGHNLSGETVHAETDSGSGFTSRGSVVPTTAYAFKVTLNTGLVSHDKARLRVTTPAVAMRVTELFFAKAIEFPFNFADDIVDGDLGNVARFEDYGGTPWKNRRGPDRWQVSGVVTDLTRTQRLVMRTIWTGSVSGTKPFFLLEYLSDAAGVLRYVEWVEADAQGRGVPMAGDLPLLLREVPWEP